MQICLLGGAQTRSKTSPPLVFVKPASPSAMFRQKSLTCVVSRFFAKQKCLTARRNRTKNEKFKVALCAFSLPAGKKYKEKQLNPDFTQHGGLQNLYFCCQRFMLCQRSTLYFRQSSQNGSGLIPKPLILFPYILEVALVDAPRLVGAFGYLIKTVRRVGEQLHHLSYIGKVELDDVAITTHFSDIGAHVADTGQLHFLLYQFQMFELDFEVDAGQFFFFGNRFFYCHFLIGNRLGHYIIFDNWSSFDFVFFIYPSVSFRGVGSSSIRWYFFSPRFTEGGKGWMPFLLRLFMPVLGSERRSSRVVPRFGEYLAFHEAG